MYQKKEFLGVAEKATLKYVQEKIRIAERCGGKDQNASTMEAMILEIQIIRKQKAALKEYALKGMAYCPDCGDICIISRGFLVCENKKCKFLA